MSAENGYSNNENKNFILGMDTRKTIQNVENSRWKNDDEKSININTNPHVNPPPPPLPGVFIFDRPNQHHTGTNGHVFSESYNRCSNITNLPSSGYSVQLNKTKNNEQGEFDKVQSNSTLLHYVSSSLQSQPTVSDSSDSILLSDTSHHLQTLEPITPSNSDDSLPSSESKVYHQLNTISPNHYKFEEESKSYHAMSPVSLSPRRFQQLSPVPVTEEATRENKVFQELKPLLPQCYDPPQYSNSKLYQQLCQPRVKEDKLKHQLEMKQYHLRPATVVEFEKTNNRQSQQTSQQNISNISSNVHPTITNHNGTCSTIRESVIKSDLQINRSPIIQNPKHHQSNSQVVNSNKSPSGFKEDKPKVYLELRNPSLRPQLPKPPIQQSHYSSSPTNYKYTNTNLQPSIQSTTPHSSPQSTITIQKPQKFKLPGPYEFNLSQQNSPNKYKLPKILGPNEYQSTEINLNPVGKRHKNEMFPPVGMLASPCLRTPSTSLNRTTSFTGMRSKVPLSLPKTPLCYGDPGIKSQSTYYPENTTMINNNPFEPSSTQQSSVNFEEHKEITPVDNAAYSVPVVGHSKLREELLKPKPVVRKTFVVASEKHSSKTFPLNDDDSQFSKVKEQDNDNVPHEENKFTKLFSRASDSPSSKKLICTSSDQIDNSNLSSDQIDNSNLSSKMIGNLFDKPNKNEQCSENVFLSKVNSTQSTLNVSQIMEQKDVKSTNNVASDKVASQITEQKNVESTNNVASDKVASQITEQKNVESTNNVASDKVASQITEQKNVESTNNVASVKVASQITEQKNVESTNNVASDKVASQITEQKNVKSTNNVSSDKVASQITEQKDVESTNNVASDMVVSSDKEITDVYLSSDKLEVTEDYVKPLVKSNDHLEPNSNSNVIPVSSDGCKGDGYGDLKNEIEEKTANSKTESTNDQIQNSQTMKNLKDREVNNPRQFVIEKSETEANKNTDSNLTKHEMVEEMLSNCINKVSYDEQSDKPGKVMPNKGTVSSDIDPLLKKSLSKSSIKTESKVVTINAEKDCVSCTEEDLKAQENKCGEEKQIRVKRKYTRRMVPENERRTHTKRKASWGLKEVIEREKSTYAKRHDKMASKLKHNEDKIPKIKKEVETEDEDGGKFESKTSLRLQELVPRKKRKYTRRKMKNIAIKEEGLNYNKCVKRKYIKQEVDSYQHEKRNFTNKKSPKKTYQLVDPLEEGLISDDEGEAVFLGFDMTDEEDETILGFEMDSDEDNECDLQQQLLAKLEDADCVTVECDPRSLLQSAAHSVTCPHCSQRYTSHAEMVAHMASHATHPYMCGTCPRGFATQVQLDRHRKWMHQGGKKYKCSKCPKMFTTSAYAKRHSETAHREEEKEEEEEKEDMEEIDEEEEEKKTEVAVKEEVEQKISTFYCGECTETFNTEDELKEHEDKVHKKTLFQCEKCLKYFQKFANLQRHKMSHNEESQDQSFPCAYCNEKFSSRESLHAHWPVHSEKKVYTCDICDSNFTALNSLKRHRILHAGEKLFRCEICQRSFSLLSTLKTHLLIHTGAKRFECKLCGKTFNRRDVLNAHQWVHTGEKKFECDVCSEKFRWRHAVRSHKLIYHSTEKPYTCQVCGKQFSHPDSFKKHREVHAERLFYCQICLKAFSRASTLKTHIATHTDLKPFFCEKCNKGFRSKSHLRNHFLVHTKEKPWLCKFCNKTFKDRIQLRRHKRVVHCKAFYQKILPNLPDICDTLENFEVVDNEQKSAFESQMDNTPEELDIDPSQHFISLPAETDFPTLEENVIPSSVF